MLTDGVLTLAPLRPEDAAPHLACEDAAGDGTVFRVHVLDIGEAGP